MKYEREKPNDGANVTSEVDSLFREAGLDDVRHAAPQTDELLLKSDTKLEFTAPKKQRRKGHGLKVFIVVFIILICLSLIGSVIIAEPWVIAVKDTYTEPSLEKLPPQTLAVGESYTVGVELSDNEQISEIVVADPDVLTVNKHTLTAVGEYFTTTALITTTEIAVPVIAPVHTVTVGQWDFSKQYDELRSNLRDLLGIEPKLAPRTELRELAKYEIVFHLNGLLNVTEDAPATVEAYLQNPVSLEFAQPYGGCLQIQCLNETTAKTERFEEKDGVFTLKLTGLAEGQTKLRVYSGFWKTVDATTYKNYLDFQKTDTAAAEVAALTELETRENQIFIPTALNIIPVSVLDRDKIDVKVEYTAGDEDEDEDEEKKPTLPTGYGEALAKQTLALINKLRVDNGLDALKWDAELVKLAKPRSSDLASEFAPNKPDGASYELISGGYYTAQSVFDSWNACDSTRAKLLDKNSTKLGVMFYGASDGFGGYWDALIA